MVVFCSHCGTALSASVAFCSTCGTVMQYRGQTQRLLPASHRDNVDMDSPDHLWLALGMSVASSAIAVVQALQFGVFNEPTFVAAYVFQTVIVVFAWVNVFAYRSWARTFLTLFSGIILLVAMLDAIKMADIMPGAAYVWIVSIAAKMASIVMLYAGNLGKKFS